MTHPGGRPLKFKSVAELEKAINAYFKKTKQEEWTITGLADALDTYRSVLCDYQERDEFSNTVKKAKQKVEMAYEISLRKHGRSGDIFGLKNFGWKDRQEVENNVNLKEYVITEDPINDLPPAQGTAGNNQTSG